MRQRVCAVQPTNVDHSAAHTPPTEPGRRRRRPQAPANRATAAKPPTIFRLSLGRPANVLPTATTPDGHTRASVACAAHTQGCRRTHGHTGGMQRTPALPKHNESPLPNEARAERPKYLTSTRRSAAALHRTTPRASASRRTPTGATQSNGHSSRTRRSLSAAADMAAPSRKGFRTPSMSTNRSATSPPSTAARCRPGQPS